MRQVLAAFVVAALCAGCSGGGGGGAEPPLPPGPTSLSTRFLDDGTLILRWSLGEGPYDGLVVEGRVEDQPWSTIGWLPVQESVAIVLGPDVPERSILTFRVGGLVGQRYAWSDELATIRPVHAPAGLTAYEYSQVILAWRNASRVATTAEVARRVWSLEGVTDWSILPVADGATSTTDALQPDGRVAEYRVRYVYQGAPGLPAFTATAMRPIRMAAPAVEVIEGVGLRVTPPSGDLDVRVHVSDERGLTSFTPGAGVLEVPGWPISPVTRVWFDGTAYGPGRAGSAPVRSAATWLPPFALPGARPLVASSLQLPFAPDMYDTTWIRGPDGRFHGRYPGHIAVDYPDAPSDIGLLMSYSSCLGTPTVDALGRVHHLQSLPLHAGSAYVTHWLHDASGWHSWEVTTYVPVGVCDMQAGVAADGTVHVAVPDPATGVRYLTGTGGAYTAEPAPAGTPTGLAVAPEGTAYLLGSEGLSVRDPLGLWSDGGLPAELAGVEARLLAGDGGRLAVVRTAQAGTSVELRWRERNLGAWGAEEVVAAGPQVNRFLAVLGEDGDLGVVGGNLEPSPGAGSQPAVFERRAGVWRHVPIPGLSRVGALGQTAGRLWVLGQTHGDSGNDPGPASWRSALYQDP